MDGESSSKIEQDASSPYLPPAGLAQDASNDLLMAKKESLSAIALTLSLISLFGPMVICVLSIFSIIHVHWDSLLIPELTLFIGFAASVAALIISVVARVKYGTWRSFFSILAAILAMPGTLAATWLLAMIGLAGHPV